MRSEELSSLAPEVLSVFVPPFTTKEDGQVAGAGCATLGKARRCSFQKKREKPGWNHGRAPGDLILRISAFRVVWTSLPYPSCASQGACVASEPKDDYVHFLVLTDVCGNRTYGVIAQYYLLLHGEYCFYNGKTHWEPSVSSAGHFIPFAVCVVSQFPYYNSLKDCLS